MGVTIDLGDKVKDTVTGAIGTVVGRAVYSFDNASLFVAFPAVDGHPFNDWVSEDRMEKV